MQSGVEEVKGLILSKSSPLNSQPLTLNMSLTPFFRDPFFEDIERFFGDDRFFGFEEPQLAEPAKGNKSGQQVAERPTRFNWLTSMRRFPAMDVVKKETEYMISCDVPGVNKADVKVQITADPQGRKTLTISGERKEEHVEEKGGMKRTERGFGKFSRSMTLPGDVDDKDIKAKQDNGVLVLTLPRTKQPQSPVQTVQIQ